MLSIISLRLQCFITALISVAIFRCCLGEADVNPANVAADALHCFNSKHIYNECNQEYRLNESGDLHVPCESTNPYCYGPCLSETRRLLDCLEEMVNDFRFYNQATTHIIRKSLDEGCSYSRQRGTFIVGDLSSRETCDLFSRADHTVRLEYAIGLIVGFFWLVFLQYQ